MKRGDEVYFSSVYFVNGERRNTELKRKTTHFLRVVEDVNPPTVEVSGGSLGSEKMLVRPTDIELKSEVDEREKAAHALALHDKHYARLYPIIAQWNKGLRISLEIARACGIPPAKAKDQIQQCKTRGFIHEDTDRLNPPTPT